MTFGFLEKIDTDLFINLFINMCFFAGHFLTPSSGEVITHNYHRIKNIISLFVHHVSHLICKILARSSFSEIYFNSHKNYSHYLECDYERKNMTN